MQPIKTILAFTLLFANQVFSQFEARNGKGISAAVKEEGQKLFASTCASCHNTNTDNTEVKTNAPSTGILAAMTSRTVYSALATGKMKLQAANLTDDQKKAISQFITNQALGETVMPKEAFTTFNLQKKQTYFRAGEETWKEQVFRKTLPLPKKMLVL